MMNFGETGLTADYNYESIMQERAYISALYNSGHDYQQMLLDLKVDTVNSDGLQDIKLGALAVFDTMVTMGVLDRLSSDTLSDMQAQIQSLHEDVQKNLHLVNAEKQQRAIAESSVALLSKNVINLQITIKIAKAALSDMTSKYNTSSSLLDLKTQQLTTCQADLIQCAKQLADAKQESLASDNNRSKDSAQIIALQTQLKALQQQEAHYQADILWLNKELKRNQQLLQTATDQLVEMKQKAGAAFDEVAKLQQSQKDFDKQQCQLQNQITAKDSRLQKCMSDLQEQAREMKDALDGRRITDAAMRQREQEIVLLEKAAKNLTADHAALAAAAQRHGQQMSDCKDKIDKLEKESEANQHQYEKLALAKGCLRGLEAITTFQQSLEIVCSDFMSHIIYGTPISDYMKMELNKMLVKLTDKEFAVLMSCVKPNTAKTVELRQLKPGEVRNIEYIQSLAFYVPKAMRPLPTILATMLEGSKWRDESDSQAFRTSIYNCAIHHIKSNYLDRSSIVGQNNPTEIIRRLLQNTSINILKLNLTSFAMSSRGSEQTKIALAQLSAGVV